MNEYEVTQRQIDNLKKRVAYARSKKASWGGTADKRNPFVVMENKAMREIKELQKIEKPTFWIDKDSAAELDFKAAERYKKYKTRNIRIGLKDDASRSKHVLVSAKDLSLGYGDTPLFEGVNIDLREGEAVELRGRNGAGKTTLIKALLLSSPLPSSQILEKSARRSLGAGPVAPPGTTRLSLAPRMVPLDTSFSEDSAFPAGTKQDQKQLALSGSEEKDGGEKADDGSLITLFSGELKLDPHARVGVYEQEVSPQYFGLTLHDAIERMYLDKNLSISETKIRQLMADYLFVDSDGSVPIEKLSGGQKARFQVISMLAHDPQLLILDEPTNHLDLPSIEELETALARFTGAVLYVSHDNYFRDAMGGEVVQIGA